MTLNLADLRERYKQQYSSYKELVDRTKPILHATISRNLKDAVVDGRPKEPYSFVQKALRKYLEKPDEHADPFARITDRAGLRVVVVHLDDAKRACELAVEAFETWDHDDKGAQWKPNELGYQGLHMQARLKSQDVSSSSSHLLALDFEIQVQTKAQAAWSAVSHAVTYKPPGGGFSRSVETRIYRAVALVSVFDEQIALARAEMVTDPRYAPIVMLETLQREFLDWLTEPTDDELSLRVLEVVQHAYSSEDDFPQTIDLYVRSNRDRLDPIFNLYRELGDAPTLLFQPEVVAIAERLDTARERLVQAWQDSRLPYELLDELATALGRPLT